MKWISVKDRLPEEDQMVLAYEPMWGNVQLAKAYDGLNFSEIYTHWQPLPQPPGGDEG